MEIDIGTSRSFDVWLVCETAQTKLAPKRPDDAGEQRAAEKAEQDHPTARSD